MIEEFVTHHQVQKILLKPFTQEIAKPITILDVQLRLSRNTKSTPRYNQQVSVYLENASQTTTRLILHPSVATVTPALRLSRDKLESCSSPLPKIDFSQSYYHYPTPAGQISRSAQKITDQFSSRPCQRLPDQSSRLSQRLPDQFSRLISQQLTDQFSSCPNQRLLDQSSRLNQRLPVPEQFSRQNQLLCTKSVFPPSLSYIRPVSPQQLQQLPD
ncbi:hypothetical protein Pcinc_016788 [Petrolisthes cinctipes]|uniref:Uncharacterized protein n=1 Tax=Petrolisthes cinctipes TaxID=88211 RepID=A0AAE1KQL8_PETCI|nr:hypothetical protein Pcinc_016788 [Petrolisthes cinctipes]